MTLNSIHSLIARIKRGRDHREKLVDSHVRKEIAFQIRAIRDTFGWSQTELGEKVSMNQNAISRLESAEYGKPTITTLKRLAAAFDVGLVVRFVPFSEMVYWISGTTHAVKGLSTESLAVPTFEMEEKKHVFDAMAVSAELLARGIGKKGAAKEEAVSGELIRKISGSDLAELKRGEPESPIKAQKLFYFPTPTGQQGTVVENRV